MEIGGIIKRCDSWGEVEDGGEEIRNGRYGVLVMFDHKADAERFRVELMLLTSGQYDEDPYRS